MIDDEDEDHVPHKDTQKAKTVNLLVRLVSEMQPAMLSLL